MLPFGVTIPATVPQRSEIPEGLMNYPVQFIREPGGSNYFCVIDMGKEVGLLSKLIQSNRVDWMRLAQ
jgi:hypothetical protein